MAHTMKQSQANHLITCLPAIDRDRLLRSCELVELTFGSVLNEPQQKMRYVYFPLTGFISLLTVLYDHSTVQTGLIGNEGLLGATLVLGIADAPMRAVVHNPGLVLRMSTSSFKQTLSRSRPLVAVLNHYLYALIRELSQNIACTHFHAIEKRLARSLLMAHDRVRTDHFHLTHQHLATMLGVRRSSISVAAGALQARNLISYTRGEICVLDRKGLESASCECYWR